MAGDEGVMYLSRLILNPGCRAVMRDLADCHDLHRTIMGAFPLDDSIQLGPRADLGVLHRLDIDRRRGIITVLVQSLNRPDWCHLPKDYLRAGIDPEENPKTISLKPFVDSIEDGSMFRFKLRANPTRKLSKERRREVIKGEEDQLRWLIEKANKGGFEIIRDEASEEAPGFQITREWNALGKRPDGTGNEHKITLGNVVFDGVLRVTNREQFIKTLKKGIGSAKGFGFGLLTVAPTGP